MEVLEARAEEDLLVALEGEDGPPNMAAPTPLDEGDDDDAAPAPVWTRPARAPAFASCPLRDLAYWNETMGDYDAELVRSGKVPPVRRGDERFLTFVPDLGGFNNIRLSLENLLVIARSTGRTLVLPPPQTWYLMDKRCEAGCVFGLEELLPALVSSPSRVSVITAAEFVQDRVPLSLIHI